MISKLSTTPAWLGDQSEANLGTLWQVVKSYQSNRRQGTVGVKTRSLVKATGKKPFRQKKTGNARMGSTVSNLHVGGGVSHGPQARSYREQIPDGMARKALAVALAKRIQAGKVFAGSIEIPSGKTKDAASAFAPALERVGKVLVVLNDPKPETLRAVRNLRGVVLVRPEQVTALDIMETRSLIASQAALAKIEARLAVRLKSGGSER